MNLFDLQGKVAVVIGAGAGGLGAQGARALAEHGAEVAIADLPGRRTDLEATADLIRAHGGTVSLHDIDVTDEASVNALFDGVVREHGRVDIVANCAGTMLRREYDQTSLEDFERVLKVNLTGCWLVARKAGMVMSAQENAAGGRIINLTTIYADRVGPVPESAYYASKAGVTNVTRSLASELGPLGINVNALAPAVFYPTQMTAPLGETPDRLTWFSERTMLGRLGDPATDFAGPLLFLASPASSYVTGQVLYVDGGWSSW